MMLLNKALLIASIAMFLNGCNQDDPTAPSRVAEPQRQRLNYSTSKRGKTTEFTSVKTTTYLPKKRMAPFRA